MDVLAVGQETEQQRRGNVVGEVAHNAQRPRVRTRQRAVIEFKRVRLVHPQLRLPGILLAQRAGQVAVDLDDIECSGGGQQRAGQSALARTDFHQSLPGARGDGGEDALDRPRVMQEVLAEALAGAHP